MTNKFDKFIYPDKDKLAPKKLPAIEIDTGNDETKKPELTEVEKACQEFVEQNKEQVADALPKLVKDHRFVLVGESHLPESEPIRHEVATALGRLQKKGLTHIALEANSTAQSIIDSLDFTDPQIKQILRQKKIDGVGWGEGNFDILIIAKLLRLKVVLIDSVPDYNMPAELRDGAIWQNSRDEKMTSLIESEMKNQPEAKFLIFIGSDHVQKKPVRADPKGIMIHRIGTLLSEIHGADSVASIRYLSPGSNFDGLPGFMSKTPSPNKISQGKNEVLVIPDEGPVKGDARVSAADYIVTIV